MQLTYYSRLSHFSILGEIDALLAYLICRVRLFNVGLHFLAAKVAFSCPSVDRFGNNFWGLMTLGQVESVPNFC